MNNGKNGAKFGKSKFPYCRATTVANFVDQKTAIKEHYRICALVIAS